jgi:hypothetical protein
MEKSVEREQRRITRVEEVQAFIFCLTRSRFSVIILVVGLALLLSDQGQDLLIAYAEDGKTTRLAAAAAAWALSIWGWCRVLLDIRYDNKPRNPIAYSRWRKWMPRILGTLAFAVLALAAWRAGQIWLVVWALEGLAAFLYFIIKRRAISNAVASRLRVSTSASLNRLAPALAVRPIAADDQPPYASLRQALHLPPAGMLWQQRWGFRGLVAAAMLGAFVLFCTASFLAPVHFGRVSGALILFFLWAAAWLPIGSAASYAADRHGVPLLTVLVVLAAVSSIFNDNHEIPSASGMTAPAQRPALAEALTAWADANRGDGGAQPLVIVATAGGGIRAAYWTGTVLGELDREAPAFRDRLFAISGVSGGSVGATVFRALADLPPDQLRQRCPGGITECAQRILATDSLGPLAAAMLYPDLGQRFFPLPWFPDRAAALEHAWEQSFKRVTGQDGLVVPLADLSRTRPWPALFLNATWSDIGHRLVASNIRHGSTPTSAPDPTIRYSDQLAVLGHDLRLSSAAHNSARFPYVSPPGMWRNAEGKIAGRLQDGGLFENYGAETALDILDVACTRLDCAAPAPAAKPGAGKSPARPAVRPVIILITSDPSLPGNLAEIPAYRSTSFATEIRTTPTTYEHVRSGRGTEAALRLQEWSREHGDNFVIFRMCETDTQGASPPLGWALSDAAQKRIASFLMPPRDGAAAPGCYQENHAALERVVRLLGAGTQ